jgi:ribonuclease HII
MVAGGMYLINPVVAAIGVIGALAVSKALTERERQMLLDEIDIELKAVEKEISTAESNNRMKDYRQLLTYQRKLQREKQRIKYRLKLSGKDNIPDVAKEDD